MTIPEENTLTAHQRATNNYIRPLNIIISKPVYGASHIRLSLIIWSVSDHCHKKTNIISHV